MEFETIIYEKDGGIATITLNRPERLNAIAPPMGEELGKTIGDANLDDEVRVLIITGAGRGFCSGADVTWLAGRAGTPPQPPAAGSTGGFSSQLHDFEKPTIAAVNGTTAGAGFGMALACDIRIASDRARFYQIFVRRGLVPDAGNSYFLPRVVGMARACEMVFTAEPVDAEQAKDYGLVNRVVPHDELMPTVRELAAKIVAGPPIAMRLAKRELYKNATTDLASALQLEGYLQDICYGTEDFKEGAASFLEKREPKFKGK